MRSHVFLACLISVLVYTDAADGKCKCTPNDSCWPSTIEWSDLNKTLHGALIRGTPPGAVCYPSWPEYSQQACALVASQWYNSSYHATNPVSIDYPIWANNSCNPIFPNGTSVTGNPYAGENGCSIGNYPAYVVNATSADQVSKALVWAGARNIRLVIKATGHSYQGRSTGYGSLSIWTHHMRGIDYIPSFQPTSCSYKRPLIAVRAAAGHTNIDVQEVVARHGMVIVTGANPSVGLIGWLTGGGHGPLSTRYGMGADNLLEATLVTPDGKVVLANPCHNEDLFFAIRGGGGSTFGVITEVVVRAFPTPSTIAHTFQVRSIRSNTGTEFYEFLGFLHSEMQRLREGGMQGYYLVAGPPMVPTLSFSWTFLLYDTQDGAVKRLMEPIEAYLHDKTDALEWRSVMTQAETYLEMHKANFTNEQVANGGSAYGSRLLSAESLTDAKKTAAVLSEIGPSNDALKPHGPVANTLLIGHMIAAPDEPLYYPTHSSLNPAWRDTLTHLIVVSPFGDTASQNLIDAVYTDITYNKTEALRRLSPNTGAYFNEGDAYEPEWEDAFWGGNYERLRMIKRKFDPRNVLWCRNDFDMESKVHRGPSRREPKLDLAFVQNDPDMI
ncbi:hypothetical protein ACET3X_001588 [Alternaria dauci]|uniref:FAD-binding PCMH-type domain-containing protein n=1 Tax=Alternaria dauci TaxID=48095 RepID=A0ABR3V0C6_9PLEO